MKDIKKLRVVSNDNFVSFVDDVFWKKSEEFKKLRGYLIEKSIGHLMGILCKGGSSRKLTCDHQKTNLWPPAN